MPEDHPNIEVLSHHRIPYSKCPKYDCHNLTVEQIEDITALSAKKAVELAKTEAYIVTGNFVITKVGYLVGFIVISLLVYAVKTGIIELN